MYLQIRIVFGFRFNKLPAENHAQCSVTSKSTSLLAPFEAIVDTKEYSLIHR